MKSRRNTLPACYSGLEVSRNGTPWRQMTITESFNYSKPKAFKMEKPIVITKVCHVIDSDSDTETPPELEFKRAGMDIKNDPETFPADKTMAAPSPPKRARTNIGVYKPNTATPKSLPINNISPKTPKMSPIGSPSSGFNGPFITDSPRSIGSNSSNNTIRYDYGASPSTINFLDETTVPFPSNGEFTLTGKISSDEKLIMNYDENTMDLFSLPGNDNKDTRPRITEPGPNKLTVVKRLNFDNSLDNDNVTNKVEKKRKTSDKNKTTLTNKHNQKIESTKNTTVINNTSKKPRKRKNCESNNYRKINSPVKENSSPELNFTNTGGKVIIKDLHVITLTPPLRSSLKQSESIIENHSSIESVPSSVTPQIPSRGMVTLQAGRSGKLPEIPTETKAKIPSNNDVAKKTGLLHGIVEKLLTNKQMSVKPLNKGEIPRNEKNSSDPPIKSSDTPQNDTPQNSHQNNVDTSTVRREMLLPTGRGETIVRHSITPSRRYSSGEKSAKVKAQTTTLNQDIEQNIHSQSTTNKTTETQKNFTTKSDGSVKVELENTSQDKLTKHMSSAKENTTSEKASPKTNANASANASTTNCSTPKKQKMGPNTPSKNGSPKRFARSPDKGSPVKSREIKSIKSKEGRILQVSQMDELIKLFQTAAANRHLRSLLDSRERGILQKFVTMEDNKKYFLMKLFVWQRLWYNIFNFCSKAKIEYDDEKDIIDIFEYLEKEELADTDYKTSCNLLELLNRLDLHKVKEIMEERRIKPIRSKQENIKTILAVASRQSTLTSKSFRDHILESIEKKMGFAIKIKEDVFNAFYHAYMLATFTNPAFYRVEDYFHNIVHLRVVFPETPVEDYPVFYSREKFLSYARALKMWAELDEQVTNKNQESKFMGLDKIAEEAYEQLDIEDTTDYSKAPHLKKYTAQHVYTGILSACCEKMCTKNGHPSKVKKWLEYMIKMFPNSRRLGKWYEILMKLHMRYFDNISFESAAKLLIEAFETKKHLLGEIAKYDLGAIGLQLKSSKKYKIDQMYHDRIIQIIPRPIDTKSFPEVQIDSQCIRSENPGRKRAYILKSIVGMTVRGVEQVALEHYAEYGYPAGKFCEGSLVKSLLVLFFWDIIYDPAKVVPGTFLSKLQTAPLDMFTPYFYPKRKELIDQRLEEIGSEWPEDKLINFAASNWQKHSHERAVFGMIMNDIEDQPTVEVLISVIGRMVLAKIFERILKNSREFRSGMPDLLVWNVEKKESKFVEVKGENDKLSTSQKLWLRYLQQSGASIEVCHVHSIGSKRKKIKKVQIENEPGRDEAGPSSRPDD